MVCWSAWIQSAEGPAFMPYLSIKSIQGLCLKIFILFSLFLNIPLSGKAPDDARVKCSGWINKILRF